MVKFTCPPTIIHSRRLDDSASTTGCWFTLSTSQVNDIDRLGILFERNNNAIFASDDTQDINYSFMSAFSNSRSWSSSVSVHGQASNNWGAYIQMAHDGTNGSITTDIGDIVLNPAGNVGIGTASPGSKLEVDFDTAGKASFATPSGDGPGVIFTYQGTKRRDICGWAGGIYMGASSGLGGVGDFYLDEDGEVGIGDQTPDYPLDVVGDIATSTGYLVGTTCVLGSCSSDKRLKKNIVPIDNALDKIIRLQPVSFEFINQESGSGEQFGLVAQDLEKVFPEWVNEDQNGNKNINYGLQFQMLLIQAIKEQQSTIENLRARLDDLEKSKISEIIALKKEIVYLHTLVHTTITKQPQNDGKTALLSSILAISEPPLQN